MDDTLDAIAPADLEAEPAYEYLTAELQRAFEELGSFDFSLEAMLDHVERSW